MIKKIERWFYLQLQLMLDMYFRRGNAFFTYEETHTPKTNKKIRRLYKQGKIYNCQKGVNNGHY